MTKRTTLVFTLLQAVAVIIALVGTIAAIYFVCIGVTAIQSLQTQQEFWYMAYAVIGLITVGVMSIFSYAALYHLFTLCQRLKHGTAFTTVNERAMHRIALCCGVCGGTLGMVFIITLCYGGFFLFFVEMLFVLTAAYLCIGLVAYALELLLRRATTIQQENDLTI